MTDFLLRSLTLEGFRAYLSKREFKLADGNRPRSLLLYADNGTGKSSIADSIEFLMSKDGTIKRLATNATTTTGGVDALSHVKAAETGTASRVAISFRLASKEQSIERVVLGDRPDQLSLLDKRVGMAPLIRGVELRKYVESDGEKERYREIAKWFGLEELNKKLESVAKLRREFTSRLKGSKPSVEAISTLRELTNGAIEKWSERAVLSWLNKHFEAASPGLPKFRSLRDDDHAMTVLRDRKSHADTVVELPRLKLLRDSFEKLVGKQSEDGSREGSLFQTLTDLTTQQTKLRTRIASLAKDQEQAAHSNLWSEANRLFSSKDFDTCPVCDTPFTQSPHKSHLKILNKLRTQISALATYNIAVEDLRKVDAALSQTRNGLRTHKSVLAQQIRTAYYTPRDGLLAELSSEEPDTDINKLETLLLEETTALSEQIDKLEQLSGPKTASENLALAEKLVLMRTEFKEAKLLEQHRRAIKTELEKQSAALSTAFREAVDQALDELREDIVHLFQCIHYPAGGAPEVQFELPTTGKRDRAALTITFGGRERVAPSGYLSDGQLHSLALSIRLAAIKKFNAAIPFIVLDDVITSYDHDHRNYLADVLRSEFEGFQLIVLTHDRGFYNILKRKTPSRWHVAEILSQGAPHSDPRLRSDRSSEDEVRSFLEQGDYRAAGNALRVFQETWLAQQCEVFNTDISFRPPTEPPRYDLTEMAQSLEAYLNKKKIEINRHYFEDLKASPIPRLSSHGGASDGPDVSKGDVVSLLEAFLVFKAQFRCSQPDCGSLKFKNRKRDQNFAQCQKCESPFRKGYAAPTTSSGQNG